MSELEKDIGKAGADKLADLLGEGLAPDTVAGTFGGEAANPRLSEQPGDRIGHYKLLEQIGEGGYGVVYMAAQTEPLRRQVALKIIKLGMDTRQVVARFEAERQALALMDHPNIAKVLDAGATEIGRPYFVMELVRGIRITDYCDQRNLSTKERLELFMQVCQAVQHAYQKGIIHRDLKPSNILVTLHDGLPVPKVIDFGIAKATGQQLLTDKTLFTAFTQFIGTPAYMSPEQAEMSGLDIDTRSDIYSLGVLLYELLTGKLPFETETLVKAGLDEMRRVIREKEPPRPSTRLSTLSGEDLAAVASRRHAEPPKLVSLVRGDLDWIAMKCLEKDRTRRYETANGLAMDLERHLNDEPVTARPPGTLYRFQKMMRRNKVAVAAVMSITTALVLGLGTSTYALIKKNQAYRRSVVAEKAQEFLRNQAERAHQEAERQLQLTRQEMEKVRREQHLSYAEAFKGAASLVDLGDYGAAEAKLQDCKPELRGWEWGYLRATIPQPLWVARAHRGALLRLAVSPDGNRVATGGEDGVIVVWGCARGNKLWSGLSQPDLKGLAFTRDGKHLAVSGRTGLTVFEAESGRPLTNIAFSATTTMCLSSDDRFAFVTPQNPARIVAVGMADWKPCAITETPSQRINSIDSDGGFVVIGTDEGDAILYALEADGKCRMLAKEHLFHLPTPAVAVDAARRQYYAVRWMSAAGYTIGSTRQHSPLTTSHDQPIHALGIDRARGNLLSAGADGRVKVESVDDTKSYQLRQTAGINSVAVTKDGRVITGDEKGFVRVWPAGPSSRGLPSRTLQANGLACGVALSFSGSGDKLALRGWWSDDCVVVWDARSWEQHQEIISGGESGGIALFRPQSDEVLIAMTNAFRLYDTTQRPWQVTREFPIAPGGRRTAAFDTQGRLLALGSMNGLQLWNLGAGQQVELHGAPALSFHVCFSLNGQRLAAMTSGQESLIWDTASGQLVQHFRNLPSNGAVTFHPSGRYLASIDGNSVRIYDLELGHEIRALGGHQGQVCSVHFSPDGRRLASGSFDYGVRIWDWEAGVELLSLRNKNYYPLTVRFSPDGRELANTDSNPAGKVWFARDWSETGKEPQDEPADSMSLGHRGGMTSDAELEKSTRSEESGDELLRAGNYAKAVEAYQEACALRKRLLEDNHPATVAVSRKLLQAAFALAPECLGRNERSAAAAAVAKAADLDPSSYNAWFYLAPLLLEAGDLTAYRQRRRAALAWFGETEDQDIAGRVSVALLLAPAVGAELEVAGRMGDRAAARAWSDWRLPFQQVNKALADYRRRDYTNAIAWSRKCVATSADQMEAEAQGYAVLAMAHFQLKHTTEARAALARASAIAEGQLRKLAGRQQWIGWVIADLLLREATELIEGGGTSKEDL